MSAGPHGALHALRHGGSRSTSSNWSGYDVTGSGGTDVKGTWTQPAATCSAGENSWSSPWVGIDGDVSNTVEQIGTDSDCTNGSPTYYAWYEMYPKGTVTIGSITVVPGHTYSGEVRYSNGAFVLTLTDTTVNRTFSTTQTLKRANLSSIEWVMEGPSNGLLSDFGSVSFSNASGTINGVTGNLGGFSNLDPITMVAGGVTRAVPSAVSGGSSFDVTWKHS